jgi:hypothetical protein
MKMRQRSWRSWVIAVAGMIASVCLSFGLCAQDAKTARTVQAPFSLAITAVEPQVKAGAEVLIDVSMENKSDQPIMVYRENVVDQGGWIYKATASDETGAKAPETKFAKRLRAPETPEEVAEARTSAMPRDGGYVPLSSGQAIKDRINVNKLRDLSHPGKYKIQVEEYDNETERYVKSNIITVTVTP